MFLSSCAHLTNDQDIDTTNETEMLKSVSKEIIAIEVEMPPVQVCFLFLSVETLKAQIWKEN